MPEELIDIGVNLTSSAFNKDRDQTVQRAVDAGIVAMILIGSDLADSLAAIELAGQYPACYTTAGIHPHHASDFESATESELRSLAANPLVKALGETGLDFNRNYSPQKDQIRAFEQQLELACELKLPVFMHERDAHETFLTILKNYRDQLNNAVVHCFTGSQKALFAYLDMDLHIGITGWVCDERRGTHLHSLLANIPTNRLLLETDAPYLLPRTLTSKPKNRRNEPAYLVEVLNQVARCLDLPIDQVARQTSAAARAFFHLDL